MWRRILLLSIVICTITAKFHHLALRADSRRNIIISEFGYGVNGTLSIAINNFTVPEKIKDSVDSTENADKLQTDQGYDAIFFFADLPNKRLRVYRSGIGRYIRICESAHECQETDAVRTPKPEELQPEDPSAPIEQRGWFRNLFGRFLNPSAPQIAYDNYIPLKVDDQNHFSTNMSIRFDGKIVGQYVFMFHNCYNYRAHGYSDRVAVDLTVDLVERNLHSYLSLNEIPKPNIYLYMSILFFALFIYWSHLLCKASSDNIYRVHKFMAVLVLLKSLSLFFLGLNYYFLSKYGMQKEFWAVLYYITHLLKGLFLFGTIILIGTGYTFIKQFLTDRDRKVFMFVLPIQVLDNIVLIILSESEIGTESHQLWLKLFVFLDILCCFLVGLPIVWSIQHLHEGATTDGKAASNLEKLRLFRQFYIIVIVYIYCTRFFSVIFKFILPNNLEWVINAAVEVVTFTFFIIVGYKFRPANSHNYLLLNSDFDSYDVEASPKEDKKTDDETPVIDDQFLTKAYSDANVSRRVISDESSNNQSDHQKLLKKPSQPYEQSLLD
uniref:Lung seven transmembrane receptor family protein n=1 Tax=Caenorhabditis tropicalis TaxID=1561998 RepID=A0A1I7TJF9_9PELO